MIIKRNKDHNPKILNSIKYNACASNCSRMVSSNKLLDVDPATVFFVPPDALSLPSTS